MKKKINKKELAELRCGRNANQSINEFLISKDFFYTAAKSTKKVSQRK